MNSMGSIVNVQMGLKVLYARQTQTNVLRFLVMPMKHVWMKSTVIGNYPIVGRLEPDKSRYKYIPNNMLKRMRDIDRKQGIPRFLGPIL